MFCGDILKGMFLKRLGSMCHQFPAICHLIPSNIWPIVFLKASVLIVVYRFEQLVLSWKIIELMNLGISCVIHPYSPIVPTMHFNFRLFQIILDPSDNNQNIWWFGGGADLTPYYFFREVFIEKIKLKF